MTFRYLIVSEVGSEDFVQVNAGLLKCCRCNKLGSAYSVSGTVVK